MSEMLFHTIWCADFLQKKTHESIFIYIHNNICLLVPCLHSITSYVDPASANKQRKLFNLALQSITNFLILLVCQQRRLCQQQMLRRMLNTCTSEKMISYFHLNGFRISMSIPHLLETLLVVSCQSDEPHINLPLTLGSLAIGSSSATDLVRQIP